MYHIFNRTQIFIYFCTINDQNIKLSKYLSSLTFPEGGGGWSTIHGDHYLLEEQIKYQQDVKCTITKPVLRKNLSV